MGRTGLISRLAMTEKQASAHRIARGQQSGWTRNPLPPDEPCTIPARFRSIGSGPVKGGEGMGRFRHSGFGPRQVLKRRLGGAGLVAAGGILIVKILPLWIWPLAVGLWLVWAALGPVILGLALLWLGWRVLTRW